jgi:Ser/Thr protein kinase RdoA (MazF antagonist)
MYADIEKDLQQLLETTPPAASGTDAERIAMQEFGISGSAKLLVSERDQNFRLDMEDGVRYTLKISNPAEKEMVVDFQNQALLQIAKRDESIPIPRVIPNRAGHLHCHAEINGRIHIVRMLSWLDGEALGDARPEPELLQRMGRMLACLGIALEEFEHPGSNPPLLWDMKHANNLRGLLPCIDDMELRQLIVTVLDRFDVLKPMLGSLRSQVIHNDLNPGNVLLDKSEPPQISGIIDFGDLVKSPLIIDLAVASAYYLTADDEPLASALPMIRAYHQTRPLQSAEMQLLVDLIRTRLVTSLLICSWRIAKFPENREYLETSLVPSKAYLVALNTLDTDTAFNQIQTACHAA